MMDRPIHEVTLGINGKTMTTVLHGFPSLFLLMVNQHLQKSPKSILLQVSQSTSSCQDQVGFFTNCSSNSWVQLQLYPICDASQW